MNRILAAVAVIGLATVACAPEGERPPIILISIDTLRADRLPVYGYDGVETPVLDALRAESILFENAYAHMPLTLPAHASMLTGQLPPDHGVRVNMGYTIEPERSVSVASRLREAGYATGAAVSSFVLRAETGMAAGFDLYEDDIDYRADAGAAGLQRDGQATLKAATPWLRENRARPFFFLLHLYEPHRPYAPPAPFDKRYEDAYDGEIAATDAILGRLVALLEELGVYDRALILVTADHGEGLGDHGEEEHGIFLYRESMRVPMLIKPPGGADGDRVERQPVQHIDIVPTLLAAAGIEAPSTLGGVSLLDGDPIGGRSVYLESYYSRLEFGWSELRGLVDESYAYVHSPEPELFDLATDPEQADNLASDEPMLVRRYAQQLRAIDPAFEAPSEGDDETRRQLETLGYFGGPYSSSDGELPPPKSQIQLLDLLSQGIQDRATGRLAESVAAFSRILEVNPRMVLAWVQRSRSLERMRSFDRALEDMLEAASRSTASRRLYLAAGRLAGLAGRHADVATIVAPAMDWDPQQAFTLMALAELAQGRPERALEHAESALARERTAAGLVLLARVHLARSEPDAALAAVDEAARLGGDEEVELLLARAAALELAARPTEALEALEQQRVRFPRDRRGHLRLANLLVRGGRGEEAKQVLIDLIKAYPSPGTYRDIAGEIARLGDRSAAQGVLAEARRLWPDAPELRD